jgi:tetratricopeptide (TPR) repeat protein
MIVLAVSLGQQGKHEEALALHERAFPLLAQGAGPEAPPMMYAHIAIALEEIELLRLAEAEDHLRSAVRIGDGKFGGDITAYPTDQLGRVLSERGKYAEAIPLHERALAFRDKQMRHDHPDIVDSALGLGRAYVGLKQTARAIPFLERAVRLEAPAKRFEQAEARYLLAHALSDVHRAPRRARELAQNARDTLRAQGAGPKHDRDLARIEKFLADHPERR